MIFVFRDNRYHKRSNIFFSLEQLCMLQSETKLLFFVNTFMTDSNKVFYSGLTFLKKKSK